MTVEQIPSDTMMKMSNKWHRAFNAAGCDPMCHCCEKMIGVNEQFKLATVIPIAFPVYKHPSSRECSKDISTEEQIGYEQSHEVMLCDNCTSETFREKQLKEYKKDAHEIKHPVGGCFRIGGKIIH